jgi:hypothetical protein
MILFEDLKSLFCDLICFEIVLVTSSIPTRGNLFLTVRLHVWADERGTVARADSAASA